LLTRYAGQKTFSLEGGESLIALLDHLIQRAGESGVEEIVMGMAHRGRLNVLVNILGKLPKQLFLEFEGKHESARVSGDVKYHQGFSCDIDTAKGPIHLALAFNPSHLEIVDPVVEGSVRARQHRRGDREGKRVIPVLIHGDAAFSGQGVVMETLNMSQTRGFRTGGTVHIVVNNQIGFTTSDTRDVRSTLYCTDVTKMIEAPVFHVNGDDPEAVLLATGIALDYRMMFAKDVVVDLVCYRRHGHNELDEPLVTHPLMYRLINQHPSVRDLYAQRLIQDGVVSTAQCEDMIKRYRLRLDEGQPLVERAASSFKDAHATDWSLFNGPFAPFRSVDTSVPLARLQQLAHQVTAVPENIKLHPRVEKIIHDRRLMGSGKLPLDWGMAETLAYASLLLDGYRVRITGQDSGRGTFAHRHAVLHDQNRLKPDEGVYVPLQNLSPDQANFLVIDSLLSEEAVLGFEYGYSTAEPNELVIWEAQFGDFANGAQVVIDQFICSGEAKWGRYCGLVLMLPHGYDGQGPEHSSARLERFLQLCAEDNIQVCVPAFPAELFHLLRRQMHSPNRKPLVLMTPKSLLRHKQSVSALKALAEGGFSAITGDPIDEQHVTRVLACAGKVYFDLAAARSAHRTKTIAIVRAAQLYPFPMEALRAELKRYPNAKQLVWTQEEPENQGAWRYIQPQLRECLPAAGWSLHHAGRPAAASPAAGYPSEHLKQLSAVLDSALGEP
ncbi:MAG: 2-oxoglutarate dehydrogenase E1 component, partial [Burkholderiales bacterium]